MKELSIFIDESGDFGLYEPQHSPYYIISLVLHEQNLDISDDLTKLESEMRNTGYALSKTMPSELDICWAPVFIVILNRTKNTFKA